MTGFTGQGGGCDSKRHPRLDTACSGVRAVTSARLDGAAE
jgi:hypothetical protein